MIRVLYVDDEPGILDAVRLTLEDMGTFRVDTAVGAENGLNMLANPYDVILSDYDMPEVNGVGFLKIVRERFGDIPFILYTGYSREHVLIEAINNGANFYLQKGGDGDPEVHFTELAHTIEQAVERKRALEALSRSENQYQKIFNNAILGLFRSTREGELLDLNPAYAKMYGFESPEQMKHEVHHIGSQLFGNPDNWRKLTEILSKDGEVRDFTAEFFRRDGKKIWIQINASAVSGADASLLYIEGSCEDITSRKNSETELKQKNEDLFAAEEELRHNYEELAIQQHSLAESERRYRAIIDNIIDVYYRTDKKGDLIFVSPSVLSLLGYTNFDEVIGKPNHSFWRFPKEREQMISRMKEEEQVRDYEVTLLRKDGSSIEVSASARFYTNDAGEREGVEGIFRDISERKKTTRALVESEERYRRFVQHFHGIAYQVEWPAFAPILFQGDVQAITGYSETDFIQGTISWLDLVHPQDKEILSTSTHGLIQDPSAVRTLEYQILHRSGEWKWITDTAQSVAEVFSHEGLIQGTVQDITARKLAENEVKEKNEDLSAANEELNSLLDELKRAEANLSFRNQELNNQQVILNQSHKALREANRQLNLLSSITRHDILNKITIMNGYLTLVRDEAENNGDKILEYLEIIEEVTRTIEYQIEFTRIYQDLGTQEPQWIPIHTLISSINVPGMIQIHQDISNIEIYTDPICGKVFENLLDNTLRHGERVTKLMFSSHQAEDCLVITWEDDGVGIQEREKEQIFQRGYGKNTGFGLFLVREILSITGIRILETGVPGKGARFEILVPKGGFRMG